jgi:ElaB/YqjD/DUF883 family membrane-anchored ribosome-binding protein
MSEDDVEYVLRGSDGEVIDRTSDPEDVGYNEDTSPEAEPEDDNDSDTGGTSTPSDTDVEPGSDGTLTNIEGEDGFRLTEEQLQERKETGNVEDLAPAQPGGGGSFTPEERRENFREELQADQKEKSSTRQTQTDKPKKKQSRARKDSDLLELRETAKENPGLVQTAIALRKAHQTPTNQQQRREDPVPFDPAARLKPGRSDKISDLRQSFNSRQKQDPVSSFLFGEQNSEKTIDFEDVQRFTDKAEEAGLTTGELNTLLGEEAGTRIREDVSDSLQPQDNPTIDFVAKELASITGGAAEIIDTADKENLLTDSTDRKGQIDPIDFIQETSDVITSEELNLKEATSVSKQEQEDFENIVANSVGEAASIPSEIQRRIGQGQQLASGELTGSAALAATQTSVDRTQKFIEENPRRAAAGAASGFLLFGPTGTRGFRKAGGEAVDTGKTKIGDAASEASRQAQKGGFDETTVRDFVEGDLGEKALSSSEIQESFDEGDLLMGRNVPDVKESRPTRPRTRREFLAEFGLPEGNKPGDLAGVEFSPSKSRRSQLKDILTNTRKGQAQILKPPKTKKSDKILDEDTTGKDVSISDRLERIRDKVRNPDNDRNTLGTDRDRGFDRPRDRSSNRPGSDSDTGLGVSSGLGLGVDEDLGQVPGLDEGLDQRDDVRDDQPPFQEQPPQEKDTPRDRDGGDPFGLGTEMFREEEIVRDRDSSRRRRRRDRDIDLDIELGDDSSDSGFFDFFSRDQERDLDRSVGADLLGLEGRELSEEEATNPLSLRPLDET